MANKAQHDRLLALRPFVNEVSIGTVRRNNIFSNCVRASFVKTYEFCLFANKNRAPPTGFLIVASLRSVCEDIIVLSFVAKLPVNERNRLLHALLQINFHSRIQAQDRFFNAFRPEQPVIRSTKADLPELESTVRDIWKRHGWPNLKKAYAPNTRQIAEKNGVEILAVLYEYLYRLTSDAVHFNPGALLRMGWGKLPNVKFSPKHFNKYYSEFSRIYGVFLLCCFFELFPKHVNPKRTYKSLVSDSRMEVLSEMRWPEMVTFEEMNVKYPRDDRTLRLLFRFVDARRKGRRLLSQADPALMAREVHRMFGFAKETSD